MRATTTRRLRGLGVLLGLAGLVALPGAASAAPPTTLYAWSGGMAPFQPLHGARLLADGSVQVLEVTPANRATGAVTIRATVRPTPAQLAAIRARAAALPAPTAGATSRSTDGAYTLAVAEVNGQSRAILSVNRLDPRLGALVAAINAALPATRQLEATRPAPVGQRAHDDNCGDKPATEVSRTKSLKDAANQGLAKLTAKGGFEGDTVAVDLNGAKPTTGPVTMTIHVELIDAHPFVASDLTAFAAAAGKRIGTTTASNGTKLSVKFDLRTRLPTDPPTPCYHQITINDAPGYRSFVDAATPPNDGAGTGTWGGADPDWGNGFLLAHEGLHLAGLPDQYTDVLRQKGKPDVTVPSTIDTNDATAFKNWVTQAGRDPATGVLIGKPRPGHGNDIMATGKKGSRLLRSDVNALVAQAGVHLHGDPGDILANKSGDQQNLGVGLPLDMFAKRGGTAHRDGLWAYCVDLSRHIPATGSGFDVLGPAASLPGANMAQLQAVLEAIGRHQLGSGSFPYGAQEAIWAVTDNSSDLPSGAQAILTEAGIAGPLAGTSHFTDPNAASPDTAAVGPTGVIPAPTVVPEAPLVLAPRVDQARLLTTRIRAGRTARVRLALSVGVTGGKLRVLVQKRSGRRVRTIGKFPLRTIAVGDSFPGLQFPPLGKGLYRIRIIVGASRVNLPLTVG